MITHYCREDILKSQLAVQFTILNECRAEFWEFLPGGRQTVEILKSQLATKLTIWNKYRARFWEFLPGGRQTVLLADRGGGGGGGRRECAREGALCVEGLFFFRLSLWGRRRGGGRGERAMGWLRLVGSLKWQVSFAKEPYKRDYILQKRPIILRSLLVVATP